jgi:hypothetical protein
VTIRRSKTDQEGQGLKYPEATACAPSRRCRTWLAAAEISTGPVFRPVARGGRVGIAALSPYAASLVIKQRIAAVVLDSQP